SATMLDAFLQRLLQVQTSGTAEHHQVEQRVATQAVGAMNRYASHFANREQAFDDLVVAIGILSDRLSMNIGGDTTHHVMAGRNDRNRSGNRVDMSEGLR